MWRLLYKSLSLLGILLVDHLQNLHHHHLPTDHRTHFEVLIRELKQSGKSFQHMKLSSAEVRNGPYLEQSL